MEVLGLWLCDFFVMFCDFYDFIACIFFVGEARLCPIEEENFSLVHELNGSVVAIIVVFLDSGLSGSGKYVSHHGQNGGSDFFSVFDNEPNDLLGTRGAGHAAHILEVVEGRVGFQLILVLENEVQDVDILG